MDLRFITKRRREITHQITAQLCDRFLLEQQKTGAVIASSELVRYNNRILAEVSVCTAAVTAPGDEAYSRR